MNWRVWRVLLAWLFWFSLILVGAVVTYSVGFWGKILRGDPTYISVVIFSLFVFGLIWNFINVLRVQKELKEAELIESKFTSDPTVFGGQAVIGAGRSICAEHIKTLIIIAEKQGSAPSQDALIEIAYAKLEIPEKYTIYICEGLTALGLFGTLVGFAMLAESGLGKMLSGDINSTETMVAGIRQVISGIGTAIYTTLVGLACALPLLLMHLLVKNATTRLIAKIAEISEKYVLPSIRSSSRASK